MSIKESHSVVIPTKTNSAKQADTAGICLSPGIYVLQALHELQQNGLDLNKEECTLQQNFDTMTGTVIGEVADMKCKAGEEEAKGMNSAALADFGAAAVGGLMVGCQIGGGVYEAYKEKGIQNETDALENQRDKLNRASDEDDAAMESTTARDMEQPEQPVQKSQSAKPQPKKESEIEMADLSKPKAAEQNANTQEADNKTANEQTQKSATDKKIEQKKEEDTTKAKKADKKKAEEITDEQIAKARNNPKEKERLTKEIDKRIGKKNTETKRLNRRMQTASQAFQQVSQTASSAGQGAGAYMQAPTKENQAKDSATADVQQNQEQALQKASDNMHTAAQDKVQQAKQTGADISQILGSLAYRG